MTDNSTYIGILTQYYTCIGGYNYALPVGFFIANNINNTVDLDGWDSDQIEDEAQVYFRHAGYPPVLSYEDAERLTKV